MFIELIKLQDETKKPKGKALWCLTEAGYGYCLDQLEFLSEVGICFTFCIICWLVIVSVGLLSNGCTEEQFSIVWSGRRNSKQKRKREEMNSVRVCVHTQVFLNYFSVSCRYANPPSPPPPHCFSPNPEVRKWHGRLPSLHYVIN